MSKIRRNNNTTNYLGKMEICKAENIKFSSLLVLYDRANQLMVR